MKIGIGIAMICSLFLPKHKNKTLKRKKNDHIMTIQTTNDNIFLNWPYIECWIGLK